MRLTLLMAILMSSVSWAQEVPDRPDAVSLTIYNDDLALVRDSRQLSLDKGRQMLSFRGVSAQIIPASALLEADGLSLIEQNFDFDLLTPQALLQKSVGQTVRLYRLNPATGEETVEEALVLAANGGVVVQVGDRIETIANSRLPGRIVFDRVPDNLRAKPTLSMIVNAARGGRRQTELSYLTTGLAWQADYVAVLNAAEDDIALQGLVTLTNSSGTAYPDAEVQLVAGSVNRARQSRPNIVRREAAIAFGATDSQADVEAENVGDLKLYTLPARTALADNQTKQVGFLSAPAVSVQKQYRSQWASFQSLDDPRKAEVRLLFENDTAAGLGKPLPKGIFRVYKEDQAGRSQFVGEDRIDHTPEGQRVRVTLGEAFDVTVKSTLVAQQDVRRSNVGRVYDVSQRYVVANAKDEDVTVEVIQSVYGQVEILDETFASTRPNATDLRWDVPVPAKGEAVLAFTLRIQR